jgi:hypothetical protein
MLCEKSKQATQINPEKIQKKITLKSDFKQEFLLLKKIIRNMCKLLVLRIFLFNYRRSGTGKVIIKAFTK